MIWKPRNRIYRDGEIVRREEFRLLPKTTEEGYTIWLEKIVHERMWCEDNATTHKGHWWTTKHKYFLTDRQKTKLGITW